MMEYPDKQFVRTRLEAPESRYHTMTFVAGDEDDETPAKDNGIVQHVAQADPQKAAKLAELLTYLRSEQAAFFKWIEASPANSQLFAKDPIAAIKAALPQVASMIP